MTTPSYRRPVTILLVLVSTCLARPLYGSSRELPPALPDSVAMDARPLEEIDHVVAGGIRAGEMPGCVVLIGRRGKIVFQRAYGHRQLEPEKIAMTTDTVFDLASLTKPVATATSVMILWQSGKIRLCDPVAEHLPEFGTHGKDDITIFQLLTHQGGLIPDNSLADYRDGPQKSWERICQLGLREPPGTRFIYTDVGFIVLGELVRRISGKNVHEFSRDHIFQPLGMDETGYLPPESIRRRAAPTERRDGRWMQGEVHDPRAYLMGGIAGHAGLFSTASDLAVYAQMMLGGGQSAGTRIIDPRTVKTMTRGYLVSRGFRGLGWDSKSGYSSNRGEALSIHAFGHGGFTGTAIWIDPERDLFVVFLSNRLHPDGKGSVNSLAGRIAEIAAGAIQDDQPPAILTGIDVLRRDGFRQLAGRRVGLITNHTGIDRDGVSTIRRLREAENVKLVALFSPEHGLKGKFDSRVADSRHPASGLPVYSLYGNMRQPTPEMLADIDTLVFDIQDIGARFYTYISTMGLAMEAAAERDMRFVVLDRPNPIGGVRVDGPLLDAGRESFVAHHRLPVQHGMTAGELARLFNTQRSLELDLQVIEVEGWRRDVLFDATGLRWVNPSPNMRSLTEAILYPGIGLLETTNLSVGRGTDTPFEVIGAPWIDGPRLQRTVAAADLPGVEFRAVEFTPNASKFQGESCRGIAITIADRDAFVPLRTGFEIARQLRRLYPDDWKADAYMRLLGNAAVHEAVLAGKTVEEMESTYRRELAEFRRARERFLLYQP